MSVIMRAPTAHSLGQGRARLQSGIGTAPPCPWMARAPPGFQKACQKQAQTHALFITLT